MWAVWPAETDTETLSELFACLQALERDPLLKGDARSSCDTVL